MRRLFTVYSVEGKAVTIARANIYEPQPGDGCTVLMMNAARRRVRHHTSHEACRAREVRREVVSVPVGLKRNIGEKHDERGS